MMRRRLVVLGEHAEVERVVVVEHAHFGVEGRRLALARVVLDEVLATGASRQAGFVERPVERHRCGGPNGQQPPFEPRRFVVDVVGRLPLGHGRCGQHSQPCRREQFFEYVHIPVTIADQHP